ncbi:hypothetical protein A2118_03105 [Candidatus Kaiserbacteria bacterium GWA2_50_9]|uniref:DUF192 domain-containing protein n=1 Tax=Candidatus Kaiserbacteria bacterium GWA2_50_9 TaxID=1798474 RepID=A0A1F6BW93_9BACT|nr:MAG: hypothetical protein A2118_03105 [Candidatus Kaiserbacteria bacterium GWA2_50_9]
MRHMTRTFYIVLLIVVVAGAAFLLINKTAPSQSTESIEQAQSGSTAEFGGVSLRIEYATTTAAREFGLGGRESIALDEGMLFVFLVDDLYGFWMNDMLIPVDIFWLDAQGQVVSIEQDVAPETYPNVFYPTAPARYVLETVAGFAREHNVVIGTPLSLKNFPSVTE